MLFGNLYKTVATILNCDGATVKLVTSAPVMIDQPLMRDHFCNYMALHLNTFVSSMKDNLSYKTTFCGPMG